MYFYRKLFFITTATFYRNFIIVYVVCRTYVTLFRFLNKKYSVNKTLNVLITHLQLFVFICCSFSKSSKHDVKFSAKTHHSDAFSLGGASIKFNLRSVLVNYLLKSF